MAEDSQKVINYLISEEATQPFQTANKLDSKKGIITEIVEIVFKKLGYHINYISLPVMRLKNEVSKYKERKPGALKMFLEYSSPAWEGENQPYLFSIPIFELRTALVINSKKGFKYQNISD